MFGTTSKHSSWLFNHFKVNSVSSEWLLSLFRENTVRCMLTWLSIHKHIKSREWHQEVKVYPVALATKPLGMSQCCLLLLTNPGPSEDFHTSLGAKHLFVPHKCWDCLHSPLLQHCCHLSQMLATQQKLTLKHLHWRAISASSTLAASEEQSSPGLE